MIGGIRSIQIRIQGSNQVEIAAVLYNIGVTVDIFLGIVLELQGNVNDILFSICL